MKRFFSFLALLCLFFRVGAQEKNIKVVGLKAGDHVQNIALGKILNPGKEKFDRLSDLKGRLLILDFWATSCGACIENMPRLDSLAAVFGDRLMILPVTNEKADMIVAFQRNNGFLKGEQFMTVVEDAALGQLFPHRLLPHEVWIDGSGTVLGFSAVEDVTSENIRQALDGKVLQVNEKVDVLDYDRLKPLLVHHNGGDDSAFRYRSIICGHLPGVQSAVSIRYDTLHDRTVVKATNLRIRQLYAILFKGIRALPDSQVNIGKDQGVYCYELDFQGDNRKAARTKMQEDLDTFFNVRSEWTGNAFRLIPRKEQDSIAEPLTL